MGRLVTADSKKDQAAAASSGQDSALTRIAKYIPGEVLAFFSMIVQGLTQLPWPKLVLPGFALGTCVGLVVTFVYFDRWFPNEPPKSRQAHKFISTLAFAVYAYNLSPQAVPEIFIPGIALFLTAIITLVSAIVIPK